MICALRSDFVTNTEDPTLDSDGERRRKIIFRQPGAVKYIRLVKRKTVWHAGKTMTGEKQRKMMWMLKRAKNGTWK